MKNLTPKWAVELGLGKNPVAQFGAPVSFTASLPSITPGQGPIPLATSGLANGFRTPYVIDEIRMQAYMATPAAIIGGLIQPSYAVQFQFRTGVYAFSKTPIPMTMHAPVYNTHGQSLFSSFAPLDARIGDEARWLLPKPLWMAPGDQIQCDVSRLLTPASAGNLPFTVDVTYVGRSLKPGTPGPKSRCVPWVANYVHDFSFAFSQTQDEFRNPLTYPLTIQRLIGRPLSKATNGLFDTYGGGVLGNGAGAMLPDAAGSQYAAIYIEDSLGYKITRSAIAGKFTPTGAVFDTERCAWTFARPLGPREQLNMQFQTQGTVVAANQLFAVSMLGYREETA